MVWFLKENPFVDPCYLISVAFYYTIFLCFPGDEAVQTTYVGKCVKRVDSRK
jgi:hypothetical protein